MTLLPTPSDVFVVITTYRPDSGFPDRVERVRQQVGGVVIVDDGDSAQNVRTLRMWFAGVPKITLHHNVTNMGIAAALNMGISIARREGATWILTLDDDSLVLPNMVEVLFSGLQREEGSKPVALIGTGWTAKAAIDAIPRQTVLSTPLRDKRGIITSGSLFSLETYDKLGPFREEFFIDAVDYDFCLRARSKGFRVCQIPIVGFLHTLGDHTSHTLGPWTITTTNHSPGRLYYSFRNTTVLALEHVAKDPLYAVAVLKHDITTIGKILLFESRKREKLSRLCLGIAHGLTAKLGKRVSLREDYGSGSS